MEGRQRSSFLGKHGMLVEDQRIRGGMKLFESISDGVNV